MAKKWYLKAGESLPVRNEMAAAVGGTFTWKKSSSGSLPGQDAKPGYVSVYFPQSAEIKALSLEI